MTIEKQYMPPTYKILIIDDSLYVAETWREWLKFHGLEAELPKNAEEAVRLAKESDFILLDHQLYPDSLPESARSFDDPNFRVSTDLLKYLRTQLGSKMKPVGLWTIYSSGESFKKMYDAEWASTIYIWKDAEGDENQYSNAAKVIRQEIEFRKVIEVFPPSHRKKIADRITQYADLVNLPEDHAAKSRPTSIWSVFHGPPGSGKSFCAEHLFPPALELLCEDIAFEHRKVPDTIYSSSYGKTEQELRKLANESHDAFNKSAGQQRTVILWRFDEIDRMFANRTGNWDNELNKKLTAFLLTLFTDPSENEAHKWFPFCIIFTTNFTHAIDPALADRISADGFIPFDNPSIKDFNDFILQNLPREAIFETGVLNRGDHVYRDACLALAKNAHQLGVGYREILQTLRLADSSRLNAPPPIQGYLDNLAERSRSLDKLADLAPTTGGNPELQPPQVAKPDTPVREEQNSIYFLSQTGSVEEHLDMMVEDLLANGFTSIDDAMKSLGEHLDRMRYWGNGKDCLLVKQYNFVTGGDLTIQLLTTIAQQKNTFSGNRISWTKMARELCNPGIQSNSISNKDMERVVRRLRVLAGKKKNKG